MSKEFEEAYRKEFGIDLHMDALKGVHLSIDGVRRMFTAGRALGRREMKGDVKAWLITGSRIYQDSVAISEGWADFRIKERDDGASYKVPLYAIEAIPEEV